MLNLTTLRPSYAIIAGAQRQQACRALHFFCHYITYNWIISCFFSHKLDFITDSWERSGSPLGIDKHGYWRRAAFNVASFYQGGHGRTIEVFQTRYNRLLIVLICGCGCMLDENERLLEVFSRNFCHSFDKL